MPGHARERRFAGMRNLRRKFRAIPRTQNSQQTPIEISTPAHC
jgi:hypothetical protein